MRERYIAPVIMLVAGAITSVFNIVNEVDFLESLKQLLIILILFYIIGRIAAKIITKAINNERKQGTSIQIDKSQTGNVADINEKQN